ncbi:DUF3099 domain-containing protein [Streptomyces sp. NPDC088812]|uniref:DUF3099 domain-containing protein n=1 Tax=Streptomyces sp. NPDC088812 TaxID=3365905 RepID=UPI00380B4A78
MRKRSGAGNVQVFRITGARQGLQEDVRGRQRRYVISMTIRTLSVILAAVLWNVERHVAVVALILGGVLPYVAVVIANAGRENAPGLPSTFVTAPERPMLTPPRAEGGSGVSGPKEEPSAESAREPAEGGPTERRPRATP